MQSHRDSGAARRLEQLGTFVGRERDRLAEGVYRVHESLPEGGRQDLLDDEPHVRRSIRRVLRREGMQTQERTVDRRRQTLIQAAPRP